MSKFCIYMHLHHNMCCLAMLRQTSTLCLRLGVHSQPSVKYEEMGDFCEQGKTSLLTTFKQNASRVCMSVCVCVCVCVCVQVSLIVCVRAKSTRRSIFVSFLSSPPPLLLSGSTLYLYLSSLALPLSPSIRSEKCCLINSVPAGRWLTDWLCVCVAVCVCVCVCLCVCVLRGESGPVYKIIN